MTSFSSPIIYHSKFIAIRHSTSATLFVLSALIICILCTNIEKSKLLITDLEKKNAEFS
jgi:hypothetical protein